VTSGPSHIVIIPSYNTGPRLAETVREALSCGLPVMVVIDGSTDGSAQDLSKISAPPAALQVITLEHNSGKGAAVLRGFEAALATGFSHAVVMDADGQHPAEHIARFVEISKKNPDAMILGVPQFAADSPLARRHGRRVGNWWANLETLWGGINDSLFGFRIYPVASSVTILQSIRGGRRYDFDTELVVRLFWAGVQPINVPVPVRYFTAGDGGVSHFRYIRDNWLLFRRHTKLVLEMLPQLRRIWRLSRKARRGNRWPAGE